MGQTVFLTGFMGTGKSHVGRLLAERLSWSFRDSDGEIERLSGRSIAEIFRVSGEAGFRDAERRSLERLGKEQDVVIATGGGAAVDPVNRRVMRRGGRIVCLRANPEVILERVGHSCGRPLLEGATQPETRVRELLAARASAYADADFTVETSDLSPEAVAERIVSWLVR